MINNRCEAWLARTARIRHDAVRDAVRVAIIAPSSADRIDQYHARRAAAGGLHPSELASRAALGLRILRRMAYAERIRSIKRSLKRMEAEHERN